ncbi:hypothetical protein P9112_003316 [Eukaryota sp. TZLM1-RC]
MSNQDDLDMVTPNTPTTAITLSASISQFFPRSNIKWIRSHLNAADKIMRYTSLFTREFINSYPDLAFALTDQNFRHTTTDVFSMKDWFTNKKQRPIESPYDLNFQSNVLVTMFQPYLKIISVSSVYCNGETHSCHSRIIKDICKNLAINSEAMHASLFPTSREKDFDCHSQRAGMSKPKSFSRYL